MAKYTYPTKGDFKNFIEILQEGNYPVKKNLPPISEKWFEIISSCVDYVGTTAHYEDLSLIEICSRLLYKVAKRHELGDGNKRSSVMAVYLFCVLNDYFIWKPAVIKQQAKRAAATKGRVNELVIRKRIATVLEKVILPMNNK
jgi:prophage maintenance system killer protein